MPIAQQSSTHVLDTVPVATVSPRTTKSKNFAVEVQEVVQDGALSEVALLEAATELQN